MAGKYNNVYRLGVDASDFKKKMEQAGATAESTGKRIKKALTMSELGSEVRSIMGWGSSSTGITGAINERNFDAAKSQLSILKSYRDQLAAAEFDDLQFGEVSERVKVLEFELAAYMETLKNAADAEEAAAESFDEMGRSVDNLKTDVRSMNSELDQTSSGLRKIGPAAKSSTTNMEGLLKSIRRLGIASLAMRFVRGIFGELGTITRQYISENEALQAQVNGLRSAMGSALAPAINVVTNALSALMPYVVGVSNAIGTLLSALGGGWANVADQANNATAAIKGAGGAQAAMKRSLYGFDEITKLNEKSSGGGGGESSPSVQIMPITPQWLDDFVADMKAKIQAQDWSGVGNIIVDGISYGLGAAAGGISRFVNEKIWQPFLTFLGNCIDKAEGLYDAGENIWFGIGLGIAAPLARLGTWINDHILKPFAAGFKKTFKINSPSAHPDIIGIGKNIMLGILNGILEPWKDPVGWIKKNVLDPLVSGFSGTGSAAKATVDVRANLTTWKDKLRNKAVNFQTNLTTWKDSLKNKTVQKGTMNVTTIKDQVSNKTFGDGIAAITNWIDRIKSKVITAGTMVVEKAVDNVKNPTVNNGTVVVTKASDKIPASARKLDKYTVEAHKWEDSIDPSDKTLGLKAKVQKGWAGTLESALGIDNLYSKLNVEVPDIKVKWDTSYSQPGNSNSTSVHVPKYELTYPTTKNELGAIFTGESLLGRVGGRDQIAGEAGREALLPLDRHTWWMDDIADRVVARVGDAAGGQPQTISVNLVVDGKILANTVVRNVNAQARATGKNPLAAYI